MAQRVRHRSKKSAGWLGLVKGLAAAIVVTVVGVALFALTMQWVKPADGFIRGFNQVLKLLAIAAGVWVAVGRGGEGGLIRGALIGLLYMALGVAVYALLTGQNAPVTAYLADLGMGVAGGGIVGAILCNFTK